LFKYKQDLKTNISKFDKDVGIVLKSLNVDVLNKYSDDSYSAVFFIEDKEISVKKLIEKSKYYQKQEIDIESEDKSRFVNLDELVYEFDLKSK